MRIAVPVTDGEVSSHFGRCERFLLADIDPERKEVLERTLADPPEHSPGTFPRWLSEQKVEVVIAGGMGPRAQGLLAAEGIRIVPGAHGRDPDEAVQAFLEDRLEAGENVCDH
jgi:predicted Fe-Mo cluster-binding NifX family protein